MSANNGTVLPSDTNAMVSRARPNPIAIESLKQLYEDKDETGDVCFIIGSDRIRAHRCVLAAISSKYKTQFYGSQPDKSDVEVVGTSASAFRKFIEFFYLDEIVLTVEDIEGVLDLAKQSLVNQFVQLCVDFLIEITPLDNMFLGYRLAVLYDIDVLKNLCESLIEKDTVKVLKSEDFIINCDRDLLLTILKLDTLNCRETEAFDACIEWAKAACKRRNVDPDDAENLRHELDDAINQIRFGSMTIEEFVIRQRSYGGLFSQDETNEIFYMIGQLKDFKSEKFNQTPRNRSTTNLAKTSAACVVCNRVISYKPDNSCTEYVMGAILSFTCNHSIRLEGFTVGCCDYEGFYVLLLTLNGRNHHIKTSSKQKKQKNETTITFDEPVDVERNIVCQILFDFKNLKMSTGYKLATKVSSDNVTFVFDYVNFDDYVTKLLYNLK
ncbi:BTB/POZ domain-containing protein 2-like [Bradysia coprophila]|uniref:BTB/POZ domain-containing protein 2-like n=1 Tax=Bradysia coprophila TaxID=38358 RepID=UPI00187D9374|nr:BTB/POZ domain-containing protein 2-like [Bradysia coprophila]